MAATIVCSCEVCGIQRGPANHWLMARIEIDHEIRDCHRDSELAVAIARVSSLSIQKWDDHLMMDERYKHLCGPGCASKLLSTTLETMR